MVNCQQGVQAAGRASCVLGCINHSITGQLREVIVLLHTALVCTLCSFGQCEEDMELLESIQRTVTKALKPLEGKIYKEWLKSLI